MEQKRKHEHMGNSTCMFCNGVTGPYWKGPDFDFTKCKECGLVIQDPFPSNEDLMKLYSNSWADPGANSAETGGADEILAKQYVDQLAKSLNLKSVSGLKILDYGAGRGFLMKAFANAGADITGIEPYGFDGLEKQGLKYFTDLSEVPEGTKFDGIVTMDVVEHLREPWVVLDQLHDKLVDGGWLCVSTPNPSGLNAKINKGMWREATKAGHILFMDERTLGKMLEKSGYNSIQSLDWAVGSHLSVPKKLSHLFMRKAGLFGTSRMIARK